MAGRLLAAANPPSDHRHRRPTLRASAKGDRLCPAIRPTRSVQTPATARTATPPRCTGRISTASHGAACGGTRRAWSAVPGGTTVPERSSRCSSAPCRNRGALAWLGRGKRSVGAFPTQRGQGVKRDWVRSSSAGDTYPSAAWRRVPLAKRRPRGIRRAPHGRAAASVAVA